MAPASIFADLPLTELAVRMAATAFVVIAVSWAVGAFGPFVGGALAGLPIVLGPGFYFLAMSAPAPFVFRAAAYALLSLCATQCFLLAYIVTAGRSRAAVSLLAAVAAWLTAALAVRLLPGQPLPALALFLAVTAAAWRFGGRFVRRDLAVRGRAGFSLLLARGIIAGVLVALVTAASARLGPAVSGLLMAFPVGYTMVGFTLHQKLGAASAVAMLHSAITGSISLAGFCIALALTIPHWSAGAALTAALATSAAVTCGILLRRRVSRRGA
ncbi:hypothetical protein [Oleispirillum naphthae]|uniref:hypothetical protein n=1 Tax=Oleispirillum naphthae TaxID=2838853 RepID=UPI003082442D